MGIESISANIRCDGCNQTFVIPLDPAGEINGGCLDDHVRFAVANGLETSEKGNHLLCSKCTTVVDEAFPSEPNPTYDQVSKALNEHFGV